MFKNDYKYYKEQNIILSTIIMANIDNDAAFRRVSHRADMLKWEVKCCLDY